MNLTEFAASRNIKINALSNYLSRHPEIKKLTFKTGKETELTDEAIDLLDKIYPLPKPVTVINGVDPEEHKAVVDKLSSAQENIIKLHETVEQLKDKVNENEKLIAQAEAQKILLEDKKTQLEAARAEGEKKDSEIDDLKKANEDLRTELERLKNRGFLDRLFNK